MRPALPVSAEHRFAASISAVLAPEPRAGLIAWIASPIRVTLLGAQAARRRDEPPRRAAEQSLAVDGPRAGVHHPRLRQQRAPDRRTGTVRTPRRPHRRVPGPEPGTAHRDRRRRPPPASAPPLVVS